MDIEDSLVKEGGDGTGFFGTSWQESLATIGYTYGQYIIFILVLLVLVNITLDYPRWITFILLIVALALTVIGLTSYR